MIDMSAAEPAVIKFGRLKVDFSANKLSLTDHKYFVKAADIEMAILRDLLQHQRQIRVVAAVQEALNSKLDKPLILSNFQVHLSRLRGKLNRLAGQLAAPARVISIRTKGIALIDPRDPATFPPEYASLQRIVTGSALKGDQPLPVLNPVEEQTSTVYTDLQLALLACFINAGDKHVSVSVMRRNLKANKLGDLSKIDIKGHLEGLKPLVKDPSRERLLRGWSDGCYSLTNLISADGLGKAALPFARLLVPKLRTKRPRYG